MLRIDHVVYAMRDLDQAAVRFGEDFGLDSTEGGRHERGGTANRIVPWGSSTWSRDAWARGTPRSWTMAPAASNAANASSRCPSIARQPPANSVSTNLEIGVSVGAASISSIRSSAMPALVEP
jgi:hypothetical protein